MVAVTSQMGAREAPATPLVPGLASRSATALACASRPSARASVTATNRIERLGRTPCSLNRRAFSISAAIPRSSGDRPVV